MRRRGVGVVVGLAVAVGVVAALGLGLAVSGALSDGAEAGVGRGIGKAGTKAGGADEGAGARRGAGSEEALAGARGGAGVAEDPVEDTEQKRGLDIDPWRVAQDEARRLAGGGKSGDDSAIDAVRKRGGVWGQGASSRGTWLSVNTDDGTAGGDDQGVDREVIAITLPGYDPVGFAERFDPSDPAVAVLDDSFREGLLEFDSEWPLESIVVTLELMAEKNQYAAEALRLIMAEHVESFVDEGAETTRDLAFDVAEFILAEAPELPEIMNIAQQLVEQSELGGLMAMYVATAAHLMFELASD